MRNNAIEVLQQLPEEMESHMEMLLEDEDVDVRGFAIDIMNGLGHAKIPEWLATLLTTEEDLNVCAKAAESLAEVGLPTHIPALQGLLRRFPDVPYLTFTVELAIRRIAAGNGG
ncbi:MAG: HEAT repeat domain-containing protein, partial [Magnetococcales bacterium]|nr:HEAT repeat domain-containing protein [Magnetococcales bacterium]